MDLIVFKEVIHELNRMYPENISDQVSSCNDFKNMVFFFDKIHTPPEFYLMVFRMGRDFSRSKGAEEKPGRILS